MIVRDEMEDKRGACYHVRMFGTDGKNSKNFFRETLPATTLGALPLVLAVIAVAGYFGYRYDAAEKKRHADLETDLRGEMAVLEEKLAVLASSTKTIDKNLSQTQSESAALANRLRAEQEKASSLESTVSKISGTVGTLEKLAKTDPELLQKYSKVFFLSEHYVPERLIEIPKEYLYSENRAEEFEQRIWPYLQRLLDTAKKDGVTMYIRSAYRSFGEQKQLKSAYSITYGAGTANQFSADQGYSEHQLGTTVDFITTGLGGQLSGFEKTQAYAWLLAHAHEYGFTLSYPPNNSYYIYEPWHWRFVGAALAVRLKTQAVHFYDLDQREIDKYLVGILD